MKIEIEIPEGKKAEWVDGVLTLVDEQPPKFKFNVGDKVIYTVREDEVFTINKREILDDKPHYFLVDTDGISFSVVSERFIEPYTELKDITERIKTFEDAVEWCEDNSKDDILADYSYITNNSDYYESDISRDILAYLKLRIITCALNEGWEPTFEGNERRFSPRFISEENEFKVYDIDWTSWMLRCDMSAKLVFKSEKLAKYAATQFKDIYMDFCYKGKE